MRTFWIITLVLVTVLVMATAASASVRDSVASLVGDRSGAAEDGGGGTFTVTATKTGGGEPSDDAWVVKNDRRGEDTLTYRIVSPKVVVPAAQGDCVNAQTDEGPDGPDAMDGGTRIQRRRGEHERRSSPRPKKARRVRPRSRWRSDARLTLLTPAA